MLMRAATVLVVAAIILSFIASFIACFILLVIGALRRSIDSLNIRLACV